MQINGEKVAIFWCKVYGVGCKGGDYSACTPRTGQVAGGRLRRSLEDAAEPLLFRV